MNVSPDDARAASRAGSASTDAPPADAAPRRPLTLADFDFQLPPELIAQHPVAERSASRLLDGRTQPAVDRAFRELPGFHAPYHVYQAQN